MVQNSVKAQMPAQTISQNSKKLLLFREMIRARIWAFALF